MNINDLQSFKDKLEATFQEVINTPLSELKRRERDRKRKAKLASQIKEEIKKFTK